MDQINIKTEEKHAVYKKNEKVKIVIIMLSNNQFFLIQLINVFKLLSRTGRLIYFSKVIDLHNVTMFGIHRIDYKFYENSDFYEFLKTESYSRGVLTL